MTKHDAHAPGYTEKPSRGELENPKVTTCCFIHYGGSANYTAGHLVAARLAFNL